MILHSCSVEDFQDKPADINHGALGFDAKARPLLSTLAASQLNAFGLKQVPESEMKSLASAPHSPLLL